MCSNSRDSFSGYVDRMVLIETAKSKGVQDFEMLLHYANEVDNLLIKNRDKTPLKK